MDKVQSLAEFLGASPPGASDPDVDACLDSLTVVDFCKRVLASRAYRQSVIHRLTLGTLPAAVEVRLYDYAEGKPVNRVEHTGKDGQPIVTEVRRVIIRTVQPLDEDAAADRPEVTH